MHPELQEALDFHHAIVAEAGKALVGYETEKALANVVLMSEIPTTYDKDEQRQVNAGNLLLRGVPGIGKTFFGVIIAAISDAKFARIQGRALRLALVTGVVLGGALLAIATLPAADRLQDGAAAQVGFDEH